MTQDQFPTEKCTFTLAFDCKTIPIAILFIQLRTSLFKLRRYVPVFTDNYRFPYNDVSFNVFSLTKEDVGFEPTHAFTRLTVFKTVPFSQTWVILHKSIIISI